MVHTFYAGVARSRSGSSSFTALALNKPSSSLNKPSSSSATLCQRPPCVRRAAHHRAKRRVGVWCSLPMLGPCAQAEEKEEEEDPRKVGPCGGVYKERQMRALLA